MSKSIDSVVTLAMEQVGYIEKASNANLDDKVANAGINNYTKFARDIDAADIAGYKVQGLAWCADFYFWPFLKTFGREIAMDLFHIEKGFNVASCTSMMMNYKANGKFFTTPEVGDQILFSELVHASDGTWSVNKKKAVHCGLVTKVDNEFVYTVEGNTTNTNSVVENGGCVFAKKYPLNYYRIIGYGRPDWSVVLSHSCNCKTTIEDFKALWNEFREELRDNDSQEWSAEAREWAIESGLITGIGSTESGELNYAWEDVLSREQVVTMLYRFAKIFNLL